MTAPEEHQGEIVAVCLGPGGIPKLPVPKAQVTMMGLVGDGHRFSRHGGLNRALCLFSVEDQLSLQQDGVDCADAGSFGENVLTRNLDYGLLRPGDRLALGPQVRLEIFDVRTPCATLKSLDERFPDLMVGRSGFVCRVLTEGPLEAGMTVSVLAQEHG